MQPTFKSRRLWSSAVFSAALCLSLLRVSSGAPLYTVSGSSILKNGLDFVIHGINVNGPGEEENRKVAQDVSLIVDTWKFNLVRVSCSVSPKPELLKRSSSLDEIVQAFTARGVPVILSPRDHVGGFYDEPAAPPNSPTLSDLVTWQKDVATRYKNNPNVWFEVMADPGNRDNKLASDDWLEVHERIIRVIRQEVGAQNIIVCMGYGQGADDGNVGALMAPDNQSAILTYGPDIAKRYDNVVFAIRAMETWNTGGTIKLNDFLDRTQAKRLPVIVSEYGLHPWSDSTSAVEAVLAAGKARKLGHVAWQWTPNDRSALCAMDDHMGGWDIDAKDGSRPDNLTWLGDRVWTDNHNEPFHGPSLDRTGWTATSFRGDQAKNGRYNPLDDAFAGYCCEDDVWESDVTQAPGQWLRIDMGSRQKFTRVLLDSGAHSFDYPRGYELYVSNDGVNWGAPIAVGKNDQSVLRISFPVQNARFIKLVQTGKTWHWWYVANFEVFAPFGTPPPPHPAPAKETPVDMHGWLATAFPSTWTDVHVPLRPLQYDWERASTNRKAAPGYYFQVDMQQPQRFNRILISSGRFWNDFMRGYELYVSANGTDWGMPIARGRGAPVTDIVFAPVTARYLRVVQTRESNNPWTLVELRVFTEH